MTRAETFLPNAIRPLRHFADFRGRSTRTELVAFYLLIILTGTSAGLLSAVAVTAFGFPDPGLNDIMDVVWLIFLLPLLAVMTRRMHDQGRSGWLLLAAASPALAAGAWKFVQTGGEFPIHVRGEELPVAATIIVVISWLAILVLLFLKDEQEANRYGPNPRYDEPVQAEPRAEPTMQGARE